MIPVPSFSPRAQKEGVIHLAYIAPLAHISLSRRKRVSSIWPFPWVVAKNWKFALFSEKSPAIPLRLAYQELVCSTSNFRNQTRVPHRFLYSQLDDTLESRDPYR